MNRAAQLAQKKDTDSYDQRKYDHTRHGKRTGRARRARERLRETGHRQKGRAKARMSAKGAKPNKDTSKTAKAPKSQGPRTGTKSAKMLALLARSNGASLAELMKATGWQAHSVRGFLSTASRKRRIRIESSKNGAGERIYRAKK